MLQHIVFFKFTNRLPEEKENALICLQTKLGALKDEIGVIQHLECGRNISKRPVAYDLALLVSLENEKALEEYRIHPAHQKVVEYIKEIKPETAVVDYFV